VRILPAEPWSRNAAVVVATVFVVFTGFAFVLPFLPIFVRELGVGADEDAALWAGVLLGVSPLLAGLLAPVWGHLADRQGQKRVALLALAAYVVILLLSARVTSVQQLLLLRIGLGLFGGIGPLGLAMATSRAPRDQTGRAVGMVQAAQILAAAIGPIAGGLLADAVGIRQTFVVTALACAAALVLVAALYQEGPLAPRESREPSASFVGILRLRGVPALLITLFLVNFIGRSLTPVLPAILRGLGVAEDRLAASTGAIISAYAAAAAVSATAFGRASRRIPPHLLLGASLLGGALTLLPMAFASTFGVLVGLAVALGLASGGSLTLCYTIGGLMVAPEVRGAAFGFFAGAALFGGAVSPSVAGLLAQWDLAGIFYLDTALYVVLIVGLAAAASQLQPRTASTPRP
jgi:DHA1 family multidrug resistance protein-like MFS transporter